MGLVQSVLPKSDLRKTLKYVRNHSTELTCCLEDPFWRLDPYLL